MTGLIVQDRRPDGQLLAFDLIDILRLAGTGTETSTWRCEYVECIGGSAPVLHRVAREGSTVGGLELLRLAGNVQQIVDGNFMAYRPGDPDPWLVVRAIDSSLYVVITEDARLLGAVRARFRDVHESPADASWLSRPPVPAAVPRERNVWKVFALYFCVSAPVAGFLGFWFAFGSGMMAFGPRPRRAGAMPWARCSPGSRSRSIYRSCGC